MNLKQKLISALTISFLSIFPLQSHGENYPGPHGGKIKMPGTFHTEVLTYKNLGYKIFLLDINFQNPISINSSVYAKVKSKGKDYSLKCSAHPDHFYCERTGETTEKDEELLITAERSSQKGIEIKYLLPLERN